MMTLSASTWLMSRIPGTNQRYTIEQCLSAMKAAGFDYADANLWNLGGRNAPLGQDNWFEWAENTRAFADSIKIAFRQTHGQTLSAGQWDDPNYPDADYVWATNYRCIEVTRILGAGWMVMHPWNLPHDPLYSRKKAREANLFYLAPYIEAAKKAGIGIAIENMVDFRGNRRRYCGGDPEELIELVDIINDPSVGICIDTGHAHLSGIHVGSFIRMVGPRLQCTHISDNNRDGDTHLPPFMGSIDWADTMRALADIGYTGDFSLELGSHRYPDLTRATWCRFVHDLGEDLLTMANRNV
ncbi:MAG TPA: sugar phosphate isomerase/epimerase [Clostridiales bacterium]|jgi:sugar phosphate isomerase/epimerase|nr:sugar phosphate isomerase/epimerase [Clostridiales bacterium]